MGSGFNTWKENLSLAAPFVLDAIVTVILGLLLIIATLIPIVRTLMPFISNNQGPGGRPTIPQEMMSELVMPMLVENIGMIIIAGMIFAVLSIFIRAFFVAGGIGMLKEASETGATILSDMIDYGRGKVISLFIAKVMVVLIMLVGLLFMMLGPVGVIITVPYIIFFAIALSLVDYAVILDDLGPIDAIRKGIELFMDNRKDVFLIFLVPAVTYFALLLILFNPVLLLIGIVVYLVVLMPIITALWTSFYLSRTNRSIEA